MQRAKAYKRKHNEHAYGAYL